ncbi:S41 family peptidase [Echinicola jeungdonensis]|uniref:S41 family peptidase n=1 Tax=Echinicola jeungdonensis TaxID=709343 RepID=A0ABV5JAN4_9BACT|nr:S41 family peptidase [Echinicola jeungdonensis]MDN3670265.1 S41 family peptidase [Echinicola jeungdonensis]
MDIKINFPRLLSLVVFLPSLFFYLGCQEDIEDPVHIEKKVKSTIYQSMKEWYYWNERLPASVNPELYDDYEGLLDQLRYEPLDRWSYITTQEAFARAFTGQNIGHGFGWSLDENENLFLTFVYEDSPAGQDGWQRGWEILKINGQPISNYKTEQGYNFELGPSESGISNSFTFLLPDGSTTTRNNTKAPYQSNSVLYQDIIDLSGNKVGYWAYNSFKATAGISPTKSLEVDNSLQYFESQSIDELIIDLRYNGGGSVAVAEQILNYLVPSHGDGKIMYTNQLNVDKAKFNESKTFDKKGNLELERIIFITSRGSASSSELVINCLTPYLDVILIGENTYGKPVGAFPLSTYYRTLAENDLELVPITFATANANGNAEYYEGFPVDFSIGDDFSKNWGEQGEPRLEAALNYILQGSFPAEERRKVVTPSWNMIDDFEGLKKEFPVY